MRISPEEAHGNNSYREGLKKAYKLVLSNICLAVDHNHTSLI